MNHTGKYGLIMTYEQIEWLAPFLKDTLDEAMPQNEKEICKEIVNKLESAIEIIKF